MDLFNYHRRETSVVHVGAIDIGGENPIRVQSMTTTNTNDTQACIEQAERIIKAGGELVRLTTQGSREAENLKNINAGIRADGYNTPLVADIHFNPHVADVAALYAEKVRINPGNYVDPARKFIHQEYTDEEYAQELQKIEDRLVPFINICKENHTAVRIGVNHGSLSDRIRNRYGDTPEGIVESCMEFLRIFKKENFNDVVISIKSSNTVVMVRSVRLLVETMNKEGMNYPLHLGVTEAGEGEDGRIKSAVGIGALLSDGIGDTGDISYNTYLKYRFLKSNNNGRALSCASISIYHLPLSSKHPKSNETYIVDYNVYGMLEQENKLTADGKLKNVDCQLYPIFPVVAIPMLSMLQCKMKFLVLQFGTPAEEYLTCLKYHPEVVVVCATNHQNRLGDQRALVHEMMNAGVKNPVIFTEMYHHNQNEKSDFQLESAADLGALLIDGLTDGIWLMNDGDLSEQDITETAFGILQAARLRTSKTEYISCPGCGRTLYDLRDTIAKIREATKGMKGLKIGIMGCIVNGPGEMADADYGYVGAGPKRVSLYRKQVCIEKNIPEELAVEHLLALIKSDQK